MSKLLIVCHGNINRSPLAAAILSQYPHLEIRQGRLKFGHRDEPASRKMRDAATELGLNLEGHRSRDITLEDIAWADGVIYMDSGNLKRLQAMVQETPQSETMQAHCLAHFGDPPRTRIPDPAFIARGTQEFHDVVLLIKHCAERLAESLAPRS